MYNCVPFLSDNFNGQIMVIIMLFVSTLFDWLNIEWLPLPTNPYFISSSTSFPAISLGRIFLTVEFDQQSYEQHLSYQRIPEAERIFRWLVYVNRPRLQSL